MFEHMRPFLFTAAQLAATPEEKNEFRNVRIVR